MNEGLRLLPVGASVRKHERAEKLPTSKEVVQDIRGFIAEHPRRIEAFGDVVIFEELTAKEQEDRAKSLSGRFEEDPMLTAQRDLIDKKKGIDPEGYGEDSRVIASRVEKLGLALEREAKAARKTGVIGLRKTLVEVLHTVVK